MESILNCFRGLARRTGGLEKSVKASQKAYDLARRTGGLENIVLVG